MIPYEQAERKRFELWYNTHWDTELITGPDDVEAAWEIWKAAIDDFPVNAVGYVGISRAGEPTRFRTGCFGGGHPVYLSPVSAVISEPHPTTDITKRDLIKQAEAYDRVLEVMRQIRRDVPTLKALDEAIKEVVRLANEATQ